MGQQINERPLQTSTPADGDLFYTKDISDLTAGANGTSKRFTWLNLKTWLKSYFDTLYEPLNAGTTISNKVWTIFGDSFSDSLGTGDYPYYVIQKTGMQNTDTNAVSGNKIDAQLAVLDALIAGTPTYFNTYDICSLLVGVNDYANDTTLGAVTDTAASATFAGYLMDFIETVLTTKPTIQLYIMTFPEGNSAAVPYRTANGNGNTVEDFRDLIVAVCEKYAVPCIDLWAKSQFNLQTFSTYTTDNLHPDAAGSEKLANIIADAFISYNRG